MPKSNTCLNCGEIVHSKFCPECGQSTDTERFSLKYIFKKDVVRKTFRFSGGFFFTAKKLLTQPGYSIRSYVNGKRVNYLNYIDILLLIVAFNITILNIDGEKTLNSHSLSAKTLSDILAKHGNILYAISIPIISVVTYLFFRNAKQNFAEHIIMNIYKTSGAMLVNSIIYMLIYPFNSDVSVVLFNTSSLAVAVYSFWFYYQYFRQDYEHSVGYWFRIIFAILTSLVLCTLILIVLFYYFDRPEFEKLANPQTILAFKH
jgi:Protein of unknown function (DUF3667).